MYKVLVVEDEVRIRKGLIYLIDWSLLQCIVVGEAANGVEGLAKIIELSPDIVITDIEMPLLNGLSMIEQAKSTNSFESIIITGYNEFQYAKKGIHLGVIEYVLKPVSEEEITNAINQSIQTIKIKQSYLIQGNQLVDRMIILKEQSITNHYSSMMIDYVNHHYSQKIILQDLVDEIGVSATYLHNEFKKHIGMTFNEYLSRFRIQKAIQLMKDTKLPLYKIAEACGYQDHQYFYKVFQKYTNMSPKQMQSLIINLTK